MEFNDENWKVHINGEEMCKKLVDGFDLRSTYYENGVLSEETRM